MALLVGTQDGVYRSRQGDLEDTERVLDSGVTIDVLTDRRLGAFAASKRGLYRSTDTGTTWERLGVPRTEVYAVAVSPDGNRLYAGTHPAHLYVSPDAGQTWRELEGFQALPSRSRWHTPRHRGRSHVRSLGVHPDVPQRIIAGVEVGGVHVSDDDGLTWTERRDGLAALGSDDLQYDVHDVHVVAADEYVVSCGGGLYRTNDAGRTWTRLDRELPGSYFHEALFHRGTLYAAVQTHPPMLPMGADFDPRAVDASLFESTDGGETFEQAPYPGAPEEFISTWAVDGDRVLAGTTAGRVIVREDGAWATLGQAPSWVRSLADA